MITPREKAKVFISSACGKGREKYNIVRAGLKALIESTQLADVYIFEDEGASTHSAENHYTYNLERSDVCIFLIDNADGVPFGVQKEVDCVKKYSIKSLYYFCDKDEKNETPLQKSLMGAKFSKCKTIHSFEGLIYSGARDLINDIVFTYKERLNQQVIETEYEKNSSNNSFIAESMAQTSLVATKEIITNIDKCKSYFAKLVLHKTVAVKYSDSIDEFGFQFLKVLFEGNNIENFNIELLSEKLAANQSEIYHPIVARRWKAIKAYFQGDIEKCLHELNLALNHAKANLLPAWVINDIMIDIRNQKMIYEEIRQEFSSVIEISNDLDASTTPLHYPLLDRFDSMFYEKCIEGAQKQKLRSHNTFMLMENLESNTDMLANTFIVSFFNGSLTHLIHLHQRIQYLALNLCERYSDWHFKVLLIKTAIINGDTKQIERIVSTYSDILNKMNDLDAKSIYDFSNNCPVSYRRFIHNLNAFKITGYFLNDIDFKNVSNEIFSRIDCWVKDDKNFPLAGDHIAKVLSNVALRLDQETLVSFCNKLFKNKWYRWYDSLFELITTSIDLDAVQKSVASELISNISLIISDKERCIHARGIESALVALAKRSKKMKSELDHVVKSGMPDFYAGVYLLETTEDEKKDFPRFVKDYVDIARERNKTQGENGTIFGYMDSPIYTLRKILESGKINKDFDILDSAFIVGCEVLLKETQTISEKCEAVDLIVCLCEIDSNIIKRNKQVFETLIDNRSTVETGHKVMSSLNEIALKFSLQFLYSFQMGKTYLNLVEIIPHIADDISGQIRCSKTILNFLRCKGFRLVETELMLVILQCTIQWSVSENLNVRLNSVNILLQLITDNNYKDLICMQILQIFEREGFYIKSLILRQISRVEEADPKISAYIIQKAAADTNYLVKKVQMEICERR